MNMKVLVIGYSDIARRRVLPALNASGVEKIDIASVSAARVEWPGRYQPGHFRDYDVALSESDADIAYISTVNSLHADLARKALNRGLHVIVDKPACLGLEETREIVELARRRRLCVAEATVYAYHPRIARVRAVFERASSQPTHIIAVFSIPPRKAESFRYQAELGGGAIWDLGPYAVTPGRIFFGARSSEIVSRCLSVTAGVDTGFSLLGTYPGGRSLVGSFGYTTEYVNRLDVIGPRIAVTMDRAFSPLPDVPADITIRMDDKSLTETFPPADTFSLFFGEVFRSIASQGYSQFADAMLADAGEIERLRMSAATAPRSSEHPQTGL